MWAGHDHGVRGSISEPFLRYCYEIKLIYLSIEVNIIMRNLFEYYSFIYFKINVEFAFRPFFSVCHWLKTRLIYRFQNPLLDPIFMILLSTVYYLVDSIYVYRTVSLWFLIHYNFTYFKQVVEVGFTARRTHTCLSFDSLSWTVMFLLIKIHLLSNHQWYYYEIKFNW